MTITSNIYPNIVAWVTLTTYSVGNRCSNGGNAYEVTTGGLSGVTGPTGTGSSISDGTVTWKYLSAVDYTSLAAWITGMGTISAPNVGQIWKNDALSNTAVNASSTATINNAGVSSTNTITLTTAPGESIIDYLAANPSASYAYDATNGVAFTNNQNYTTHNSVNLSSQWVNASKIQFENTGSARAIESQNANQLIDSLIIRAALSGNDPLDIHTGSNATNCLVYCNGGGTASAIGMTGTAQVINCTIARTSNNSAAGTGFNCSFPTGGSLQNCACFGFTTPNSGTPTNADHNGTDQASIGGTSNQTSLTYANQFNATGASPDFRLKSGAGLIDNGNNSVAPGADALGTTRPQNTTVDIGSIEFIFSGATTLTLALVAWAWNKPTFSLSTQNALSPKTWAWNKQPISLAFQNALATKAWNWAKQSVSFAFVNVLTSKTWNWVNQAITLIGGATTLQLAQATWRWVNQAIIVSGGGIVSGAILAATNWIRRRRRS